MQRQIAPETVATSAAKRSQGRAPERAKERRKGKPESTEVTLLETLESPDASQGAV